MPIPNEPRTVPNDEMLALPLPPAKLKLALVPVCALAML